MLMLEPVTVGAVIVVTHNRVDLPLLVLYVPKHNA